MKATIQDVAKKSGLSVVTVSRYINGATSVRESNRQRIQRAMEELNYTPSSAARTLSSGKTRIVGLLISHISDYYINEVIYSINKALLKKKYYLALSVVEQGTADSYLFEKDRVDGVIIYTSYPTSEAMQKLKEQDIPVVIINGNEKTKDFSMVASDNRCGGYMVADHLINLGHKNIGHISGPMNTRSGKHRKEGFLKRLNEEGLEPHEILQGSYSVASGYRCAKTWIDANNMPSAVFAADDQTAFGAINAFRDHGYSIPHDISIVGYDDHPFSKDLHPSLTTVRQPAKEIGEMSVDVLFEQFDSNVRSLVNEAIKPELIIRESTCSLIK